MNKKSNDLKKEGYRKRIFTLPNFLSFIRICLIPLIVWLYCVKRSYACAGYFILLSGATDIADGYIARHFNMVSDLGKILDPVADKLTQAAILICLLFRFPLMVIPFSMLAVKEIFMSVTGVLIIKRTGIVSSAHWHGKAATCLLYCMMLIHVFWSRIPNIFSLISIIVCSIMITISFVLYAVHNIKILKHSSTDIVESGEHK